MHAASRGCHSGTRPRGRRHRILPAAPASSSTCVDHIDARLPENAAQLSSLYATTSRGPSSSRSGDPYRLHRGPIALGVRSDSSISTLHHFLPQSGVSTSTAPSGSMRLPSARVICTFQSRGYGTPHLSALGQEFICAVLDAGCSNGPIPPRPRFGPVVQVLSGPPEGVAKPHPAFRRQDKAGLALAAL